MTVPKLSKSTGAFESPMITVRDPAPDGRGGHVALRDQQPQGCADAVHPDVVHAIGSGPRTVRRAAGGGESGPNEPVPAARLERRSGGLDDPLGCPRVVFVPRGGQEDLASARGASWRLPVRARRRGGAGGRRRSSLSRRGHAPRRVRTKRPVGRGRGTPPRGRPRS